MTTSSNALFPLPPGMTYHDADFTGISLSRSPTTDVIIEIPIILHPAQEFPAGLVAGETLILTFADVDLVVTTLLGIVANHECIGAVETARFTDQIPAFRGRLNANRLCTEISLSSGSLIQVVGSAPMLRKT
jgi:hypothetical protein